MTEIYVNPQEGVVRADTRSRGTVTTAERMPGNRVEMLLNDVAASIGEHLTPEFLASMRSCRSRCFAAVGSKAS